MVLSFVRLINKKARMADKLYPIFKRPRSLLAVMVGYVVLVITQYMAYQQYENAERHWNWTSLIGFILALTGGLLTFYLVSQHAKLQLLLQHETKRYQTSQKYFRAMIENIADAILLLDANGKVLYQSPSTTRISGYNLDEIQKLNALNLIHPDDQKRDQEMFAALIKSPGITLRTEHRFLHKDGHYIWLEGSFVNLLDDELNVIIFNYHDITHLKKAEAQTVMALDENLATLNRISESVISLNNEWRYTFLNDKAVLTHPAGKEGTIGRLFWEVHPQMNSPFFKEKFLTAKKTNCEVKFENFSEAFNTWFAIRIFPSRDGTTVFYTDVTIERMAEMKIKESEARLLEAQEIGHIGSWETDLNSLNVIWSPETFKIFELDSDTFQPTHTTFLEYVHEEDRANVDRTFRDSMTSDQPNMSEHRIITRAGKVKWLEERWVFTKGSQYSHARAVGTCQDITERKKAELQIETEKQLSDSLIQGLPGIFYLYDRDGRFKRWNKNLEEVSGYSAEDIRNMQPLDFFHHDQEEIISAKINSIFTTGKGEISADLYTKDKRKIPYFLNGYRIQLEGNHYLVGMGIDISERVRIEEALTSYANEVKKLTAHLEKIREEERTRIAREIHDELGQQLTGLKMDIEWIAKKISPGGAILEKITEMIFLIDQTVITIRRIVSELRPGVLDDLGLVAALEWQGKEFEKRTGIKCDSEVRIDNKNFGKELSINLFRIYQEALTNIARHSKATQAKTILEEINNNLILTVKDNGIGFEKEKSKIGGSWGLVGMRERATLFKGSIAINADTSEGGGTIVQIKIPIQNTTI
jgi:PAS domain S-box-containing protein